MKLNKKEKKKGEAEDKVIIKPKQHDKKRKKNMILQMKQLC